MACNRIFSILAALPIAMAALQEAKSEEISSFAFVRQDGTLSIDGQLVHLYGIYIPPTEQTCYSFVRPIHCANRAILALEFKISGDFVRCQPRFSNPDGSLVASCRSGEDDLSEWMLQRGWALALPSAPYSYTALERIAQSRGLGVWGIPVETQRGRR